MDFGAMTTRARDIRTQYAELERRRTGRSWITTDLLTGFVGDVGDLTKLVRAHTGVRPGPDDLPAALAHGLAD